MLRTTRRTAAAGGALLVAAFAGPAPAMAATKTTDASDPRATARAAAVKQAAALRDARKFQEGRDALAPFMDDNDASVFDEMGRNIAASTGNPNDKIASIAW